MKNIKRYTEHLKESDASPRRLGKMLIRILLKEEGVDPEEVRRIIQSGADLEVKDGSRLSLIEGGTPLHYAAARGHIEPVRDLIKAGAIVDQRDKGGMTPLHHATKDGRKDVVRELILSGADVNAVVKHYMLSPLHFAAVPHGLPDGEKTDIIRQLIEAGSKIEAEDWRGKTPLHRAVDFKQREAAKYLIQSGSDASSGFNSVEDLISFFNGDTGWVPLGLIPEGWRRSLRSQKIFGRS
jgi:ankyrin repeat protein